jgi:succinate dehydrogenase / fumarate reductase iron-sulfur subunit
MERSDWIVTFRVYRQKGDASPRFDEFRLDVNPDEYVLDAIERIWAFYDRSLTFRHACHHATCGACGMRVDGVEKLTCITRIRDVTYDGGVIRVEPLRNFPIIGDLVVDMASLYTAMERVGAQQVVPVCEAVDPDSHGITPADGAVDAETLRLADCIECGLCLSACPIAATDPDYLGPAVLAALQQRNLCDTDDVLALADSHEGVWRCHSAFECAAVCPSFNEPAWRIMDVRKQLIGRRLKRLLRLS